MQWYLPTFYGDIRLERIEKKVTRLVLVGLSPTEREAVTKLRETALAPPWRGTPWCGPDEFPDVTKLKGKREITIELAAPLGRVQGILAKLLKPERTLLNVVRFTDGRMEEITDWAEPESGYRDDAKSGAEAKALAKADEKPAAAAGTTVAQPTRGCPVPDFEKAEVRATAVLQAFLTPEQIADFERHQGGPSPGRREP